MKINKKTSWAFMALVLIAWSCADPGEVSPELNDPDDEDMGEIAIPLKELFEAYFPIGAAVTPQQATASSPHGQALQTHFSSLTAENVMKPDALQRVKGQYTWTNADQIVQFAKDNNMKVRGHTLTWHSQSPDWMFYDENGDLHTPEVAMKQLEEHITTVVSRYKGDVYAWDVVNEAMFDWDPNGQIIYREDSPWFKIMGPAYIDSAFVYARRADPDAKLFYNDYNSIFSWKRNKIYDLVKRLKDNGIPIDGIGLQGHWSVNTSEADIRTTLDLFRTLDVEIQITELDLPVYTSNDEADSEVYTSTFSFRQKVAYSMIFNVLLDYSDIITNVTFWGIGDDHTWLDKPGRKAFPFLLDEELQPKPVYFEVQNLVLNR
ncbi:endo-1,4-beta-xylanase [Belliella sp. DSM 111904]|uniref:Beta-xylanase n=1 Tax=Belliella filtrata TaxID=2923435 RepID=A0ABS9V2X3_9BACT|nr:endo-1,4-beta-xylanase [Belliella filtrata]MCH7410550.1 endo-1,4-beta-xylanase [Belliella filtrata]